MDINSKQEKNMFFECVIQLHGLQKHTFLFFFYYTINKERKKERNKDFLTTQTQQGVNTSIQKKHKKETK